MANDASSSPRINLNQADLETLITLPGIGRELAERIIRFREEVHPFEEAIEVVGVKGISEKMYRQFAARVTASLPAEAKEAEAVGPAGEPEEPKTPIEKPGVDKQTEPEQEAVSTSPVETAEPQVEKTNRTIGEQEEPYSTVKGKSKVEAATGKAAVSAAAKDVTGESELEEEGYIISPEEADDSGFRRPWLLMLVGALLGTFLTLFLLYFINGGALVIANHPKIVELESEVSTLKKQEARLNVEIEELQEQVEQFDSLSARLQNTEAEIQILKQSRDTLTGQVEDLQNEASEIATKVATLEEQVAGLAGDVVALEENSEQMQEVIDELQIETGRFDDFLTKLRDLLLAVQGVPDSSPASPTASSIEATDTPQFTPTPTPAPTPTPPS